MHYISIIINYIGLVAVNIIQTMGYGGLVFLMACESMVVPLPSEFVMPFAGFLAAQEKFSFVYVVIFSTIGSLIGSLLSYYIGKFGGNPLVKKFGKYALLDEHDLEKTQNWFAKRGERTIFISRFIPVVRHLISIPAGMGKMNVWKFSIYTIVGAGLWNAFLAYLGYVLGENWESVRKYTEYISIAVAIILLIGTIYFFKKHLRSKKTASNKQ